MSQEIPYHEQDPPIESIKIALVSLKTDLWAMQGAPDHPYRQQIIDVAARARDEIEAWLKK